MSNETLWENDEWWIFVGVMQHKQRRGAFARIERSDPVLNRPARAFKNLASASDVNPDLLYNAFLQLATYWDLQCNYDELRKIRDEMKEKAS